MLLLSLIIGTIAIVCFMVIRMFRKPCSKWEMGTLVGFGLLNIVGGIVSDALNKDAIYCMTLFPSVLIALLVFIYTEMKKQGQMQGKAGKVIMTLTSICIAVIIGSICLAVQEPSVQIDAEGITIQGMYGERITLSDVKSIHMIDHIPPTKLRTNGLYFGRIAVGNFLLITNEQAKFFVYSSAPFLEIKTNQRVYVLNSANSAQTLEYYRKIQNAIK